MIRVDFEVSIAIDGPDIPPQRLPHVPRVGEQIELAASGEVFTVKTVTWMLPETVHDEAWVHVRLF
ncbi:hypothetical protein SALGADO_76 [Arthrobacter phage Salgado]|uniref:Uncharacterized protein n=1 Tax=Arthrobacter phage Salgado TaxID=1772314 RepID=A0A0U4K187_9CAUD|nr:hypothetical protein KMD22_gp76 [Arthrobacter phage Salgado]ALY10242.1 hypothetical protein SALGADO_76 [Arthrobacter phage Salgado]